MRIEPPKDASFCQNDLHEESYVATKLNKKKLSGRINHKIKELALSSISNSYGKVCAHNMEVSPQVVLNIIPGKFNFNTFEKKKKELFIGAFPKKNKMIEKNLFDGEAEGKIPIGIVSSSSNSWINAFLQIVVYNSSLRTMFNYTSKSFCSFNNFIDQYLCDQQKRKSVTNAPTQPVIEALSKYCSGGTYFENEVVDFFGILTKIMNYAVPIEMTKSFGQKEGGLLALCPGARISIENENIDFEEFVSKNFVGLEKSNCILPSELLINLKWFLKKPFRNLNRCNPLLQLYLRGELFLATHYELDSFIEFLPDEFNSPSYLAYIKVDGTWFQCNDARIRPIRSNNLNIALSRSFMFHYRRDKKAEGLHNFMKIGSKS